MYCSHHFFNVKRKSFNSNNFNDYQSDRDHSVTHEADKIANESERSNTTAPALKVNKSLLVENFDNLALMTNAICTNHTFHRYYILKITLIYPTIRL